MGGATKESRRDTEAEARDKIRDKAGRDDDDMAMRGPQVNGCGSNRDA